jgi:hypothetical protein
MRNDFLNKTQTKLLAKDFSTAADTDLIVAGALVRAFDSVNNFDPISSTALSMIGNVGNLDVYLADPSNRDAFEAMLANIQSMNAVAASSVAMTAIVASTTAKNAVLASSTAMSAINANDQAIRIFMLAGTNQVYSNFANVAAVAASSVAMNAVAASSVAMNAVALLKTALSAIWASEVALAAIRAITTAVDTLVSSPYTVYIDNTPANLTNAMVTTKSILLKSKNYNGTDTNYLRDQCGNGVVGGGISYQTSYSYQNNVIAFSNIRHYLNSTNGYAWQAYIIDCD